MQTPRLALYARNARVPGRRFCALAPADGTDEATVYLYDMIVADELEAALFGGVDPKTFAKAIAAIDASTIHLRINSPGGSVFAARAIESTIRDHRARFVAHVDGYAASAASLVMLAADEVEIGAGAMIMIHKGWTYTWGNADDLMNTAALLEKIDGVMVDTYATATGQPREQIIEWMTAETWFTAAEALEAGFVDRIAAAEDAPVDAEVSAIQWDLSAFARAPAVARADATPKDAAWMKQRAEQDLRVRRLCKKNRS